MTPRYIPARILQKVKNKEEKKKKRFFFFLSFFFLFFIFYYFLKVFFVCLSCDGPAVSLWVQVLSEVRAHITHGLMS